MLPLSDCWLVLPLDTELDPEEDELEEVEPLELELEPVEVEPVDVEPVEVEPVEVEPVDVEVEPVDAAALGDADSVEDTPEEVLEVDLSEVVVVDDASELAWLTPNPNRANVPPMDNATAAAAIRARLIRVRGLLFMVQASRPPLFEP